MADKLIVTIGRQTGSGGRKIGQMLAERLGVKCYDKELLDRAAKDMTKSFWTVPRRRAASAESFLKTTTRSRRTASSIPW